MLLVPPAPYSPSQPRFRFRALAARAGRAPLGEQREIALACLLAARLAAALLPPLAMGASVRAARAAGARTWLGAHALPPIPRSALARLIDASAGEPGEPIAAALRGVAATCAPLLDAAAVAELDGLATDLSPADIPPAVATARRADDRPPELPAAPP